MKTMPYTTNPNVPRVRWEAIKLIRSGWSTRAVSRHLGYSQSAIAKWKKRAGTEWRGPLPTRSSRPQRSPRALPRMIVQEIIDTRAQRHRCGQVIHQELRLRGVVVSLSSVQRTLERCHLLKKRSPWKRPHDPTLRPDVTHPGALLQLDTVHIVAPEGDRIYVYTLIDLFSRWAYAAVVSRIGAAASVRFVQHAQATTTFRFEMVQTDHGPEFSTGFTHGLWRRGMQHRHSRVRQANDNAHVERFNRTIQEECLDQTDVTIKHFRRAIADYLPYYNQDRLHMGINYKTPSQMLKVIPSS